MLKYKTRVVTEPTTEPVTVEEAKRNADIDDLYFNADVLRWITRARKQVEHDARISLITQTRELRCDQFSGDFIELPFPPLVSVSTLEYVDSNGDTQTWSSGNYDVDTYLTPGVIRLPYSNSGWPSTQGGYDNVIVTYVAGFGAASAVPEAAKDAIMLLVRSYFDLDMEREPLGFDLSYNALIAQLGEGSYP